jgi:hypothetical protein
MHFLLAVAKWNESDGDDFDESEVEEELPVRGRGKRAKMSAKRKGKGKIEGTHVTYIHYKSPLMKKMTTL